MDSESKFVRALVDNQDKKVTGLGLFFNQFCVLFTKCVGFKLNFGFLIQIIIPTIFVVCGGSLIQFIQQDRASKSMHEPSQPIQSSNVEIGDSHDHDQLPFQMLSSDVGEHLKNVSAGVSSYLYYSRESDDNTEVVQNFVSRLNIRFERCFPVFNKNLGFQYIPKEKVDAQFTSDIVLKYIIIFGKDFGPSNLDYRIRSASKLFTKIPKWSIDSPDTDDFLSYSLFSEEDKIGLSYVMRLLSDTLNEFVHNQPTTEFDFSCSRNQYHTLPLSYRSGVIAANLNFDTALNVESYYRLLIQLFFLLWGTSVLGTVCREKANKSREFLRLMGASRLIIYASHFALFFIVMLTCLTLGLFIVFRHTFDRLIPIPIFFTILMLSITLFILFCFLISIFFNNTTWASLTFLLVNFCFTATIYEQFRHYFFIYLFLLLNPLNLVSVMWEMAYSFELRQLTLQQLLFEKHKMQHNLSLFEMTLYGSLVNVLYIFLIFYVDNVWPFQHGVPKPFFFLVDPNYWTCTQSMETNEECDQLIQTGDKFEKNTSAPIICVRQVEKGFYTRYRAFGFRKVIKKLSMDVCSNQLTVLLGFNGAGKTTLMDMITGIQSLNSGSIFVNKKSIVKNPTEVRRMIGLCPQENIFYSEMSVRSNLKLAGALRGVPLSELHERIELIVEELGLKEKLNEKAKNLSGGMKRRLCLACSFIGYNDVLVFDEPTSGLDPETRRCLWNVFIELRKFRTILLTTHFMEEADVLGDRIAILNQGRLVCNGSPEFLKKAYNTGYLLKVEVKENYVYEHILDLIRKFVPTASLVSSKKTELDFRIPSFDYERNCSLNPVLAQLFENLETNKQQLNIVTFGLNNTSLEDVFIKAGETDVLKDLETKYANNTNVEQGPFDEIYANTADRLDVGICRQSKAFFIKRFTYLLRTPFTLIFQIMIPIALFVFYYQLISKEFAEANVRGENAVLKEKAKLYSERNAFVIFDFQDDYIRRLAEDYKANAKRQFDINVEFYDKELINQNGSNVIFAKHRKDPFHFMFGVNLKNSTIVYWQNVYYTWSYPIMVNLFWDSKVDVNFVYQPTYIAATKLYHIMQKAMIAINQHIFIFLLPLMVATQTFLIIPRSEMSRNSILIQKIYGISFLKYWFMNLIYDWIVYMFIIASFIIVVQTCDNVLNTMADALAFNQHFISNMVVFACTGVSFIIFCYILAALQTGFESSNLLYYGTFIVTGIVPIFFKYICMQLQIKSFFFTENIQIAMYILFPAYNCLHYFTKQIVFRMQQICESFQVGGSKVLKDYSLESDTLLNLDPLRLHVYMAILSAFVYVVFLFNLDKVVEYLKRFFNWICSLPVLKRRSWKVIKEATESDNLEMSAVSMTDKRVKAEEQLVQELVNSKRTSERLLVVMNLKKKFADFDAVKGVSFTVENNECFGLLGLNGAGKTTTFSMLTGNISITSGEIHLLGKPIHNQISVGYKAIAYCPQIECNFENLTVNDILTYYARLIGFDEQEVNKVTKKMVELVDLSKYHHINSDTLSGGNKRKLSLAIALLGGRSLTYLDEPTTGVDPVARRKIWQTLNLFKKNGNKSFILTSHSMDECEYLCNRIAIMGKGQLLCLGSYSQLRDQYAQGYKLHIRLNFERITDNEYTSQVQQAVLSRIANSELKEFHLNSMVYFIRQGKGVLSQLFFLTNQLQNEFSFENYTISEATLEEVFLSFAIKRSNPNENDPRNPAKETALSPISNV